MDWKVQAIPVYATQVYKTIQAEVQMAAKLMKSEAYREIRAG